MASAQRSANRAKGALYRAGDHPLVEWGARLGYGASGVIHLLLAWLAAQIALGSSDGQASQSGALAQLAQQPFGAALLWIVTVGFALLGIWQITEVVSRAEVTDRAKAAGKGLLYFALAWTSFKFASGGHSSSNKQTKDFTASLMELPGGQFLVGLIGLAILGIGGYHVYKGWQKKFLEDLEEHPGGWAVQAGRIGYLAKGLALGTVGVLFVTAAAKHQTGKKTTGLDGALRTLRDLPAGTVVLLLIAAGIAAFGVYCFARARYARV